MKLHVVRYLALIAMFALFSQHVVAQENEEDYRQYKFYDEEDDDPLSWFAQEIDSIINISHVERYGYLSNAEYALSNLGYAPRGEDRFSRRYKFESIYIGSSASRLLSQLGFLRSVDNTVSGVDAFTTQTTNHYYHSSPLKQRHHRVGTTLSGRNYLLSLNHRATYRLSRRGVELDDDWFLAEYVRVNTGRDIYVDGLFANGLDLAFAMSREWRNNSLVITAMLPWARRSTRQATTQEAVTLTGNCGYNPTWGMQGGKLRSSRINSGLSPMLMASWQRRLGMWTTMQLTAGTSFERLGRTALAWCDAMTPMPDNYRYMPSYFVDDDDSRRLAEAWRYNDVRYTQINWDELYRTNVLQPDGNAVYLVENRRTNRGTTSLNIGFTTLFRGVELCYGARAEMVSDRRFKVADDLLGADYLLDIDYFVRDDDTYGTMYRNNLLEDDIKVIEGERFGYDYRVTKSSVALYGVARLRAWDMDFELGVDIATSAIRRRGYFEKELFSGYRSYGASRAVVLLPASLTASWSYALSRHNFDAKILLSSNMPDAETLFLQVDYNNRLVDNPRLSSTFGAEAGYSLLLSRFALHGRVYAIYHGNEADVLHYYDDLAGEYVDAVVSDIARLNIGVELDAKMQWSQHFSSQGLINIGRHRYQRDAWVQTYADNDNDLIAESRAHMRGCGYSSAELSVYADIAFRRGGWQAVASFCYLGMRHASPSFIRRTERMYSYAPTAEEQQAMLEQQRLRDATSLGLSLSKSFKLEQGRWLSLRLSVDNVLGASNIYSGYEQHRIRKVQIAEREHVRPFANKVMYGYGRTCRININFGF